MAAFFVHLGDNLPQYTLADNVQQALEVLQLTGAQMIFIEQEEVPVHEENKSAEGRKTQGRKRSR